VLHAYFFVAGSYRTATPDQRHEPYPRAFGTGEVLRSKVKRLDLNKINSYRKGILIATDKE
jgi:hypothetical protein